MENNAELRVIFEDWQRFNAFNWKRNTDIRIAQEIYATNISFMDSGMSDSEKSDFVANCNILRDGLNINSKEYIQVSFKSSEKITTLKEILIRAKVYETVLEVMLIKLC